MSLRKVLLAGSVLLAACLVLVAQTSVRLSMLSGPAGPGGVIVLAPNGQVTFATIGTGLVLDRGAGGYVLRAQSANRAVGAKLSLQSDGAYLLPQPAVPATLEVFRNGVRQSAGDDYTFDSATRKITPVPGSPWSTDDLVLADYEF